MNTGDRVPTRKISDSKQKSRLFTAKVPLSPLQALRKALQRKQADGF